jgi:hypothetical protein
MPPIEDYMHNQHRGGHGFPATRTFTNGNSGLRPAAQKMAKGRLATEELRLLGAAMVD